MRVGGAGVNEWVISRLGLSYVPLLLCPVGPALLNGIKEEEETRGSLGISGYRRRWQIHILDQASPSMHIEMLGTGSSEGVSISTTACSPSGNV